MTVLVDSSVFIDRLKGRDTVQTRFFENLIIAEQTIVIGDLMLLEVFQGVRDDHAHRTVLTDLSEFGQLQISDRSVAIEAARHYRTLRGLGIAVRKIDTLIATRCILDRLPLLYSDRDFDPFVEHLGLTSALDFFSGVN